MCARATPDLVEVCCALCMPTTTCPRLLLHYLHQSSAGSHWHGSQRHARFYPDCMGRHLRYQPQFASCGCAGAAESCMMIIAHNDCICTNPACSILECVECASFTCCCYTAKQHRLPPWRDLYRHHPATSPIQCRQWVVGMAASQQGSCYRL